MKKILLLSVFALFMASCSTESLDTVSGETTAFAAGSKGVAPCFNALEGFVTVDVSAGLSNPNVNFSLNAALGVLSPRKYYTMTLYLQPIADCEDLTSMVGEPLVYTKTITSTSTLVPTITLKPIDLPAGCYVWKAYLSSGGTTSQAACSTGTPWYDSPLF